MCVVERERKNGLLFFFLLDIKETAKAKLAIIHFSENEPHIQLQNAKDEEKEREKKRSFCFQREVKEEECWCCFQQNERTHNSE